VSNFIEISQSKRGLNWKVDFYKAASAAYPHESLLLFNPARTDWLPMALSDETWFYATLYVSARSLAFMTGCEASQRDAVFLFNEALVRLNNRLCTPGLLSDETLGAVSCMALVNVRGLRFL
jgi:hypothetical protein